MQPRYLSVGEIFASHVQHIVPLFQRPYVWNEDEQWEPLWDDIAALARRMADAGGSRVPSHFLGTIVLDQMPHASGAYTQRSVIDGQQRLTTLQIVLKAAFLSLAKQARALEDADETPEAKSVFKLLSRLDALLFNPGPDDDEDRYKVWPTNEDRRAFSAIMDTAPDEEFEDDHQLTRAAIFFRSRFEDLLGAGEISPDLLFRCLSTELKLIVLDLEPGDEPQAIFETLNAHGQPLLPADLIKNWLLWEAARQKTTGADVDVEALYAAFWKPFDAESNYWRKKVGTGHAARVRVDTFLQNWLVLKTREPVSAKALYQAFLSYARNLPTNEQGHVNLQILMAEISEYSRLYRRIDQGEETGRWGDMTGRLGIMKLVVFTPLLMEALHRHGEDAKALDDFAVALESYVIRRMFTGASTRGYGSLVLQLIEEVFPLAPVDEGDSVPSLREALLSKTDTLAWPEDSTFRLSWREEPVYRMRKARVSMILQALEQAMLDTDDFADPIQQIDWGRTQIEHVLPQGWHAHYPLEDPTEECRARRAIMLDNIGNLTLIRGKMNQSYGNAAWIGQDDLGEEKSHWGKRKHLSRHSGLRLNLDLLNHAGDQWLEEEIASRAIRLEALAMKLWPKMKSVA